MRITHRESRSYAAMRSAAVGFETEAALGSLAVWESGAVEAEVLVVATMQRPFVLSTTVSTTKELVDLLDQVAETIDAL